MEAPAGEVEAVDAVLQTATMQSGGEQIGGVGHHPVIEVYFNE